jgi:hypothetical protein
LIKISNEGFAYWNKPKIAAVLFDVQNGLFLYSPLVLLMVSGIVLHFKRNKFQNIPSLIIFALAIYLFASWWAWWFGGAFGHRCYIEYYALLAFPLTGLYLSIAQSGSLLVKYGFFALVAFLMVFSVRLSYLYTSLSGPWDGPDWRWNWEKYAEILRHFL